jgi:hypothetical protein
MSAAPAGVDPPSGAACKAALRQIVDKQIAAGVDVGNNGEQQQACFLYVRHRMSGFGGRGAARAAMSSVTRSNSRCAEMLATRRCRQLPAAEGSAVRYVDD